MLNLGASFEDRYHWTWILPLVFLRRRDSNYDELCLDYFLPVADESAGDVNNNDVEFD